MNDNEIREIPGYEGRYEINSYGTIWSNYGNGRTQRKFSGCGDGYSRIVLSVNGKCYTRYVHRLLWEAFRGPIPPGMTVNHKDLNKSNNCLDNLELLTMKGQSDHARGIKPWFPDTAKSRKAVWQICIPGGERIRHISINEAARALGGYAGNICYAVRNKKIAYGNLWEYADTP